MAKGCSVATASRKMMVSPASRMLSAISLGVFCRCAPSTRAIMRSRNVSPGLDVILTMIQSESTLFPGHRGAVAAGLADHRRRFSGDGRFVHRGHAFDDFAVAGDIVAGRDITMSPARRCGLETSSSLPSGGSSGEWPWFRAWPCAGCRPAALPRPSAMASAKLANSTVNHSHKVICRLKAKLPCG